MNQNYTYIAHVQEKEKKKIKNKISLHHRSAIHAKGYSLQSSTETDANTECYITEVWPSSQ